MLELARLGAATRPGVDLDALERVVAGLSQPDRVELFPITPRRRLVVRDPRAGRRRELPLDGLVPPAVAAEIERLGLYRRRVTSATRGYT